jgi:hypothetical protein
MDRPRRVVGLVIHPRVADRKERDRQHERDRGGDQRAAPLGPRRSALAGGLSH